MSGRDPSAGLLSVEEALARMLAGLGPLPPQEIPLDAALGRVLAVDVAARITLPPWDNSAMDGFAVRSGDVAGASETTPVRLTVHGEVAAGHAPTTSVGQGSAVRILTGAMLPPGADAVVPVEETDSLPGSAALPASVAILAAAPIGAHIRRAGSDLRAGDHLLEHGTRIRPATLAVIAAAGHGAVSVHGRPRVAILGTGDELVPPGLPLGPAQIPDSNSVSLAAQAQAAGADVIRLGIAPDDRGHILASLRRGIAEADIVVVSGGVSVGAHDEVKAAFDALGRLDLWRIAVQPGKPLAFGRAVRPDGSGEALLFGLPGNPVSSFVTFELFVRPVLRRLAGHLDGPGRTVVHARLAEPVRKARGRRAYLRVRLRSAPDGTGAWDAVLAGGQGSHILSALALADGLAIIPETVDSLPAGAMVDVIRLEEETT